MSAENTYFEQYTAYHLANSPGVGQQVTLTKIDLIKEPARQKHSYRSTERKTRQ